MAHDTRFATLFEPVRIGPVTAVNRFYQVPHCCGMGHARPRAHAAMRAMKAEGGWAVVSTEECEIHPTSDLAPYAEQRLWDARDIPALRLMTDAVHAKGALAAVELSHNGAHAPNLLTRAPSLAPTASALDWLTPRQARAMDKADIREFRRWHRAAARRAKEAGFDIIYVYAGHRMSLAHQFLLPDLNTRTDEYGGALENRVRLVRELIEETRDEVGDRCAVALRFAVDEMKGERGMQAREEGRAVVELLAELPDLWDVNLSDWSNDSATTRFQPRDGYQTPFIDFVKQVTTRPVVGVGRLSSPDMMVAMVKKRVVDLIGAARPSIADPFLPAKIRDGRVDEIRECIGCNICVASDNLSVPIRCTQNPTMGEEWRRGWHPERIAPKASEDAALVVGAGPAGLECALQLARRGYQVTLAEAAPEPGGRVRAESGLPGLAAWRRVADNRLYELRQRANVSIHTQSPVDAAMVAELGIANVFVATGSRWRRDFVGRSNRLALEPRAGIEVLSPDDIMAGTLPRGDTVILYDDDQIYLGGVLAEFLALKGFRVTLATPASVVSPWLEATLEQSRVQARLLRNGIDVLTGKTIVALAGGGLGFCCIYTGQTRAIEGDCLVAVTERLPQDTLFESLASGAARPGHLERIGDALAPGLIADAVHSGHLAARNFERDPAKIEAEFFRREMTTLTD
ncbi:MAG: FAD-dependent oxidoreductase [Paracoccaceae bacterium]